MSAKYKISWLQLPFTAHLHITVIISVCLIFIILSSHSLLNCIHAQPFQNITLSQFLPFVLISSTLPYAYIPLPRVYACILSFFMTYNTHMIPRSTIQPRHHPRMCLKPLGIYMMPFQSFLTICYVFSIFVVISDLLLHQWTICVFPII